MEEFLVFDWYSASIPSCPEVVDVLLRRHYPLCVWEIAKASNGFTHSDNLVDQYGSVVLNMSYGGTSQGANTFVAASGGNAERFAHVVRLEFPDHFLVRADVRLDFDEGGAWVTLYGHGYNIAKKHSIKPRFIGAPETERDLISDDGRSLYIGSRSSVGMVRVYEKGKKDDKSRPDWVRCELEFKPKGHDARLFYAKATKTQILSATRVGRQFFDAFLDTLPMSPCSAHPVKTKTDHENSMEHVKAQYKNVFLAELELCGGSFELFARSIFDAPSQ